MLESYQNRYQLWRYRALTGSASRRATESQRLKALLGLAPESDPAAAVDRIARSMRQEWEEYTTEVSSGDMAVSLPIGSLLSYLSDVLKPRVAMDFGSGFSSYILRSYQRENPDCVVVSIDDDRAWLERTRQFLESKQVGTEHLLTYDELDGSQWRPDLIFYDLGRMPVRLAELETILGLVPSDGVIMLDDLHKRDYRLAAKRALAEGYELLELPALVGDQLNRFAGVARRRDRSLDGS